MKIKFIPQRSDAGLAVSVAGDIITINGHVFDLSGLVDDEVLPARAFAGAVFSGRVERTAGELSVTLLLPYSAAPTIDPLEDLAVVDVASGVVDVPGHPSAPPEAVTAGVIDWGQREPRVPAAVVPRAVTMRQARLALLGAGLLPTVATAIAALPEPQRSVATIEWEYSQEVHRDRALIQALGPLLGLTNTQIDALFTAAAAL